LHAKSVDAYRKAKAMGETLAMSNLGYKFLSEGFIPEAQAECDKALEANDYHKNIGALLVRLKEVPDEEGTKLEEVLENAKPKSEFYRDYGLAISRRQPRTLPTRWQGPQCLLNLKLLGRSVELSGTYEVKSNPLALALGGVLGLSAKATHYRISYVGKLSGLAIEATVARAKDDDASTPKTLLEAADIKTKVLLIISTDLTRIRVMENPHVTNPNTYELSDD
jgi:hypothetical protein